MNSNQPMGPKRGWSWAVLWALATLWIPSALAQKASGGNPALEAAPPSPHQAHLRFEVRAAPRLLEAPASGRLLVILGSTNSPEPRETMTETGLNSAPRLGRDVVQFEGLHGFFLDASSALFPQRDFSEVPVGDYYVQAVLMTNRDLWLPEAAGNLVSTPQRVRVDPSRMGTIKLTLDRRLPAESLPADTELIRFHKIPSPKLSAFWDRPMFQRVGVILPRGWNEEPQRKYPLIIQIGGFGTRYDVVEGMMKEGSEFRKQWMAADAPRFVLLALDGAGPLGDPYQVNSDNHGPYGDSLIQEVLPLIEKTYRCLGQPGTRVLTGGSTGGWVSFALQVFYPEVFGGCWSGFPDPTDFRALQLVNIYRDTNAFVNAAGFERPCAREVNGDTQFTMRHETQLENVLGTGNSFVFSGGQWGSWNATYSPRGSDGKPQAIWDPRTGQIDPAVAQAWRRYDLRVQLQEHWAQIGPKLRGKLHIWMGDADTYFLDSATRYLDEFLRSAEPPADARIEFAPRQPHGWNPRNWSELLKEMQQAVDTHSVKPKAAASPR